MPARRPIMKAGTMPVRCIIVDDNHEFLRAARDLLERQGISVVGVASTGAQACRACQELQPDVVLLDVNLGNETGFEVARVLAQRAGQAQPRVILISAHPPDGFDEIIAGTPGLTFMPKTALSGTAIRRIIGDALIPAADGVQRDSR
jgi:CheY-like chemotaxis protein